MHAKSHDMELGWPAASDSSKLTQGNRNMAIMSDGSYSKVRQEASTVPQLEPKMNGKKTISNKSKKSRTTFQIDL